MKTKTIRKKTKAKVMSIPPMPEANTSSANPDVQELRSKLVSTILYKNISQNQVSRESEVSQPTISSFIRGNDINLTSIRKLASWVNDGPQKIDLSKFTRQMPCVIQKFEVAGKVFVVEIREVNPHDVA